MWFDTEGHWSGWQSRVTYAPLVVASRRRLTLLTHGSVLDAGMNVTVVVKGSSSASLVF